MKYFTIAELTRSTTAQKKGIDNTPPPAAVQNLRSLVENVLDPLREAYGHPIYVNSGYRSASLNSAVGGTRNSQHMRGQAADIRGEATDSQKDKTCIIKGSDPLHHQGVRPLDDAEKGGGEAGTAAHRPRPTIRPAHLLPNLPPRIVES